MKIVYNNIVGEEVEDTTIAEIEENSNEKLFPKKKKNGREFLFAGAA